MEEHVEEAGLPFRPTWPWRKNEATRDLQVAAAGCVDCRSEIRWGVKEGYTPSRQPPLNFVPRLGRQTRHGPGRKRARNQNEYGREESKYY